MDRVRRKIPLWLRIALGVAVALVAVLAAGVALRYWITSDGGRAFIVSQIDGRRIGPLGTIRLSGLEGDPLEAATVADIALVDDDGVWLRAKDARIEWTPSRLLGGELEIRAIQVRAVEMLRLPRSTYESERRPPPDIGLKLEEVIVDELHIADNVLGPTAASYRISGGAARGRDGAGFARLSVNPLSGPPDKIDASAEWTAEEALKGSIVASGPPGGVIAALAQAPEGSSVLLNGNVDGVITKFTGTARLAFDDESVAVIDVSRDGDAARLSAAIAADRWPLMAPLAQRAGGGVSLEGEANLADLARAPVKFILSAPAGRVGFAAIADLDEQMGIYDDARLSVQQLDLAFIAPPLTGKVDAAGTFRMVGFTDFVWRGDATATGLTYPSGEVAKASGQLSIRKSGSTISWELPSGVAEGGRITSLKSLAPARYEVATRGEVNLATRIVEITQAQVRGAPGDATGRGAYTIRSGAIDFAGSASFGRLSDVAPLTGSARGQWTVKRSSHRAPIRVTADVAGRNVSSHIQSLADLAGANPEAKVSGVISNGRFVVESGSFRGDGLAATMTGRITDAGAVTGRATGSLSRPLHLPGAAFASLGFTADFSGQLSAPRADIRVSNGEASVVGLPISNIAGEGALRLGDRIAGDFSLTGDSTGQAVFATGRIEGIDGGWRIAGLNARLGGVQIAAPRVGYSNGVFSAAFDANGSLAGIAGLERGTVTARGTVDFTDNLSLDIAGQLANLRHGTVRFDLISFDADATDGRATLAGRIRGSAGAPLDLAYNASGRSINGVWSGQATLEGTVDQLPISTSRPALWSFGGDEWSMDATLAAFGGNLNAVLKSDIAGASADLDLVSIDLRALTRLARIAPIEGSVTGQATFSNGPAPARGDLHLGISGANPVGVTADPVMVSITSSLRDGAITTTASGAGQGFRLDASSLVAMTERHGFDVTPNRTAPVQAHMTLTGRAEQLWALFGPEGQVLRGQLDADIEAAGTLNRPTLNGGFSVANGAYEHGETGLRLRNISAKGAFDQRSARITELTARDNESGTISGSGTIDWENGFDGGVKFSATNLKALGRDDRTAIVSGEGAVTLDDEAIRVTGEFTVPQARISIEQPAHSAIPTLPIVRRVNFLNREDEISGEGEPPFWRRPVQLDLALKAPRRIVVYGRGLDTEWSADVRLKGPIANPEINGTATLIRGDLDLAGRRFAFNTGSINLDGPIRNARIDIAAERTAQDVDARVHVTGSPVEPEFKLESTPALPQDEILARVLFGRSASELTGFEAAQLAAGLAQLAGGQAGFDPVGLVRQATGLDRFAIGAADGVATVAAGKYIAENVYVQVGAGGEGAMGAEVEWEPRDNLSITSSAQSNGDTKISVRWKNDY